jgi:hypothetical protein
VAEEDFNQISRDPAELFSLAIGILGDVAASTKLLAEDTLLRLPLSVFKDTMRRVGCH